MSTNFPTGLDTLVNPTATDGVATVSHSSQHANANDAIEALEAKVGQDGSIVTTSHDYKLSGVTGSDKAVSKTGNETLTNKTLTTPVIISMYQDAGKTKLMVLPDTASDTLVALNASQTLTAKTLTNPVLNGTMTGTGIKDEDNMASDSNTAVPTQQSVKAYVDSKVGEGMMQVLTVNISSADILALHTTPKELIPAPGAGKILVLDQIVFYFDAGSTPYANGDNTGAYFNSDTTLLSGNAIANTAINSATDTVTFRTALGATITAGIDKAIEFKTAGGTAFINGNGTAKAFIRYRTITL